MWGAAPPTCVYLFFLTKFENSTIKNGPEYFKYSPEKRIEIKLENENKVSELLCIYLLRGPASVKKYLINEIVSNNIYNNNILLALMSIVLFFQCSELVVD